MAAMRTRTTRPRSSIRSAAAAVILLLSLFSVTLPNPAVAAAGPSLVILSPAEGAVIGNGTPVTVVFNVSNFVLVQPGRVGQVASPTEGYVNVSVDGVPARLVTQVQPIPLPLTSGPHTIRLQLLETNGTPLSPDVSASLHIVATQGPASGAATLAIVAPVEGQSTGHDVYVFVAISNFTVVYSHGQPNAPNEGHIQLLRGGVLQQDLGPSDFGFLVDLPDGNNTITARLVNNDNSPLSPDVSASVTIHVKVAPDPAPSEALTGGVGVLLGAILVVLICRRRKAAARILKEQAPKV